MERFSGRQAIRATWQGILVVLTVTIVFSSMLLLLESRTNVSFIAKTKRMQIEAEIDWRQKERSAIQSTFADAYRTRSQILADFLTEHPDSQTREGLSELSRIAKTDYLMLFDSAGQEIVSSNSYTGFSVGENLSSEYQAVLLGYPYAVVGSAADPYTGATQLGTAILMTDGEGRSSGFLLAVYSTGDLNAVLESISDENTVNSHAVREGYIAAAISDGDGRFIAHTDPKMIGQKASDFLADYAPGSSFEGFTAYNGESMCVSARAANGRTRTPITIFINGYAAFLSLFALFALIASAKGWWTSFYYVFSGEWSPGVHLFSIWAALFILAVTFFCLFMIRIVLNHLENRLSPQTRTVARLAHSMIFYAAGFFLIFYILSKFGVNTTALVASAGIISIAVGMGAQSMAADLLAGFFMMLEGTVHVGDRVIVGDFKGSITGVVTDMGIRTIEITEDDGTVSNFNNSKATPLRNLNRKQPSRETEK